MSSAKIITINGGSSSIKFAAFCAGSEPKREFTGLIERIGTPGTSFSITDSSGKQTEKRDLQAADHKAAAEHLADWLVQRIGQTSIAGIGHRVVHGGVHLVDHQIVTDELMAELKRTQPLDLAHLPREIALIETIGRRMNGVPQVACFDTAFHRDMPTVAKMLPIPRSYYDAGVRKLGFHGLSYSYLMSELQRLAPREAEGRVILAHLGSGASMAAVRNGKPMDTTMAFTPTAGLVMGTRPGDLDPGLLVYLMRAEKLSPEKMDEFISDRCGLLGVSATSSDMRDLITKRDADSRAAEAVDLFCYQARKWIGALAAAMSGVDALIFSGGIGERSPEVRAGICDGLEFLGLNLDLRANSNATPIISSPNSRIKVRVIPTDEEIMIARIVGRIINSH